MAKGNTFAATAFTSYGCFWVAFALEKYLGASQSAVFGSGDVVGGTMLDVLWAVFTFLFFVPTLRKNGCLMTVFGSLALTFALLAGGHWSPPVHTLAGACQHRVVVACVCGGSGGGRAPGSARACAPCCRPLPPTSAVRWASHPAQCPPPTPLTPL